MRVATIKEVWAPVAGFPNYEISNYGRLFNVKFNRPLKTHLNKYNGYYQSMLYISGTHHNVTIHVLVAEHFIGLGPDGWEVNHIDGDKSNNYVDNLEWCTHSDNEKHAHRTGLKHYKPLPRFKIRCVDTNEEFLTASAAARHFGLSASGINLQANGHRKAIRGLHFEYIQ